MNKKIISESIIRSGLIKEHTLSFSTIFLFESHNNLKDIPYKYQYLQDDDLLIFTLHAIASIFNPLSPSFAKISESTNIQGNFSHP